MSYLHRQSEQYKAMTPEQKKEYVRKFEKRPPTTELQKLAQKENFALFQLAGILGQLNSLNGLMDSYINARVLNIKMNITGIQSQIKHRQVLRKDQRKSK